jgi:hypothetical protein
LIDVERPYSTVGSDRNQRESSPARDGSTLHMNVSPPTQLKPVLYAGNRVNLGLRKPSLCGGNVGQG